jgi:hypothetical protein
VIRWQHAKPDSTWTDPKGVVAPLRSHPVDPHHSGTGKWVCYRCREAITDAGKAVDMSWKGLDALLTGPQSIDPEQPGLQVEGS